MITKVIYSILFLLFLLPTSNCQSIEANSLEPVLKFEYITRSNMEIISVDEFPLLLVYKDGTVIQKRNNKFYKQLLSEDELKLLLSNLSINDSLLIAPPKINIGKGSLLDAPFYNLKIAYRDTVLNFVFDYYSNNSAINLELKSYLERVKNKIIKYNNKNVPWKPDKIIVLCYKNIDNTEIYDLVNSIEKSVCKETKRYILFTSDYKYLDKIKKIKRRLNRKKHKGQIYYTFYIPYSKCNDIYLGY